MASVDLEGVTRRFGNVTAIENISFEVPDGEFWVLVGPSGCGKSTVLRTIAGLEATTAGKIYIDKRLVNQIPARERDVAMVFQNYALYPHMRVADNLAFGLRMRGVDPQTVQEQIDAVARILGISHLLHRKPKQLSGGQQQRVALGRAIARQPQVFLLDEPLSNLDAQLRDQTRAELKQLHQHYGITTLYVTHDQTEAMTLADQIVVLDRGQIQQIGDPQTIYTQPANRMVATFLGNPPMNLILADYDQGAFWVETRSIPCPASLQTCLEAAASPKVQLGIRPEHLQVVTEETPAHLQVDVTIVEPLGRESLIQAVLRDSASTPVQLFIPGPKPPPPGTHLSLQMDLEHLRVFDAASGVRLA